MIDSLDYSLEDYLRDKRVHVGPHGQVWVSVREAARLLRVTRQCIYNWAREGRLTLYKAGTRTLLRRDEVLSLPAREGQRASTR